MRENDVVIVKSGKHQGETFTINSGLKWYKKEQYFLIGSKSGASLLVKPDEIELICDRTLKLSACKICNRSTATIERATGGYKIYCPNCGTTVYGTSIKKAAKNWATIMG